MESLTSQLIAILSQEWVRDIFWTVILGTATFGIYENWERNFYCR